MLIFLKILEVIKKQKAKISAMFIVGAFSALSCVSAFAQTPPPVTPPDYTDITKAVGDQLAAVTTSAKPMILAALGAGLGIFAIFLLFRLGKRAIAAATSGK